MGSFDRNMAELAERVGDGRIVGRVSFSPEKIAAVQERGTWLSGPNAGVQITNYTTPGTHAHFLEAPLLANVERYFREIAHEILTTGPRIPMERAVDSLLHEALQGIPRKTGKLAESGEARVTEELADVAIR